MAESKKKTTKKSTSKAKAATTKKAASKSTKKTAKKTATKKAPKTSAKKATSKKTTSATKKALNFSENKNSDKFAIIKIAGSQLKVVEGLKYEIKKIEGEKGDKLEIKDVLLFADGKDVKVGKPVVKGAKVTLEIDSQKKDTKQKVFKYKAKSRYRRTYGSRQLITRVVVKKIEG